MSTGTERNDYEAVFSEYEGSGIPRAEGRFEAPCTFSVFQLRDGSVILLVRLSPVRRTSF